MSKIDDLVEKYAKDIEGLDMKVDKVLLRAVAKGCGPTIYKADTALVAASDKKEVERVKQNFCIKKLGLEDNDALDEGIAEILKTYNKRQKQRAVVYYLLVQKFKKAAIYN